jgi:hypothetical protein
MHQNCFSESSVLVIFAKQYEAEWIIYYRMSLLLLSILCCAL